MNIRFMLVGSPHSEELEALYGQYEKRLRRYGFVSLSYLKEYRLPDNPSEKEIARALAIEADEVMATVGRNDGLVLLDLGGKEFDSLSFASKLRDLSDRFVTLDFVVGSSYGVGESLRKRAQLRWGLSSLTFTHPLALLLTMEQVYRALKINNGETYQK